MAFTYSYKLLVDLRSVLKKTCTSFVQMYVRMIAPSRYEHSALLLLKTSLSQGQSMSLKKWHACSGVNLNSLSSTWGAQPRFSSVLNSPLKLDAVQFLAPLSGKQNQRRCNFSTFARRLEAVRIDGKTIAQEIKDEIKKEVQELVSQGLRAPHLTVLLVGSDPASVVYVRNKAKAARYTGITCEVLRLPDNVSQRALLREIDFLNSLPDVDGILVQLPLPEQVSMRSVCDAVRPDRDVDGFNVLNVGRTCVDQEAFMPATPAGVLEIIRRLEIKTFGKNAVVCGRSKNVGMPIAMHLHSSGRGRDGTGDATTTICHRNTPREQLVRCTQAADIIVTATGVPGLITADMVKDGAVVIDIGITRVEDSRGRAKLVGDVDYSGVSQKASMITPVPGGVGPVTVAMVIKNTLIAYKKALQIDKACESTKR